MATKLIKLAELKKWAKNFTPAYCDLIVEAASVCFSEMGHRINFTMQVEWDDNNNDVELKRMKVTKQMENTQNDAERATEDGACAIAFSLMKEFSAYDIVDKARRGGGYDYWLSYTGVSDPFSDSARLEVSGIREGRFSDVDRRCEEKLDQTKKSTGSIPAFIVIVEFSNPYTRVLSKI